MIKTLADFAAARHRIYLRRASGEPGPWTDDPILRDNRFCNVFRELDTVTIWIRKNIRERWADHPHLWFMLCIARYINWPPTLARLIELADKEGIACWPSHPDFTCGEKSITGQRFASDLTWALTQIAKEGKVYTGAYMIRAESNRNVHWYSWSKHKYIAEIVLGRLWEDREAWAEALEPDVSGQALQPSLQAIWDRFQEPRYIGWGPFMAYEVVTDLRHTRYLRGAPDIQTWANAGPGAIRGLNRLHGRELKAHPKPEQTNAEMMELMKGLNAVADREVFGDVVFEMRDVEHLLCELDKYLRVKTGEGRMRNHYDWRKATPLPE